MKKRNYIIWLSVLVIILFVKFAIYGKDNVKYFFNENAYNIFLKKNNIIKWENIREQSGIYIFTSSGCKYCILMNRSVQRVVDKLAKEYEEKIYIVELDFKEYKESVELDDYLNDINIETIPSIYISKEMKTISTSEIE